MNSRWGELCGAAAMCPTGGIHSILSDNDNGFDRSTYIGDVLSLQPNTRIFDDSKLLLIGHMTGLLLIR